LCLQCFDAVGCEAGRWFRVTIRRLRVTVSVTVRVTVEVAYRRPERLIAWMH